MPVFNNALAGAAGSGGDAGYKIERSLRFNVSDSTDLSKTFSSAGNRRTWTFSAWIKFCDPAGTSGIFECTYPGSGGTISNTFEVWYTVGQIHITDYGTYYFTSDARLQDPSAWGHLVIRVDTTEGTQANRIRLYWNGEQLVNTASGTISQNADLAVNNSALHKIGNWRGSTYSNLYFAEIHHVDGQSLAPTSFGEVDATTGAWNPIEYSGSYGTNGFHLNFSDLNNLGNDNVGSNNWTANNLTGSVVTYTTSGDTVGAPDDFFDGDRNSYAQTNNAGTSTFTFGSPIAVPNGRIDLLARPGSGFVYTAVTNVGTQTFAHTGNNWPGGGSYPGHHVINNASVTSISSITASATGGSNWTMGGFQVAGDPNSVGNQFILDGSASDIDSMVDSPTNYEADSGNNGGNYATLSPIDFKGVQATSLSDGNLKFVSKTGGSYGHGVCATVAASSGKYYWETTIEAVGSGQLYYGVSKPGWSPDRASDSVTIRHNGNFYNNLSGATVNSGTLSALAVGDVIGFALNLDDNQLSVSVNGTFHASANPATGANPNVTLPSDITLTAQISDFYTGSTVVFNFGQRPFAYTPPNGFKSLCTQNFPDPTIADGSTAFDAVTYAGSGYSNTTNPSQSITGLSFSPDLVWSKARSAAYSHGMFDSVRGANKFLRPNGNQAEITDSGVSSSLVSFDSNGFTLGPDAGVGSINYGGTNYVAWTWDAGSSTVSNTDGSITSSVKANQTAGFSIVSYTGNNTNGATVGHGLNATPSLIIIKNRSTAYNWIVLYTDTSKKLYLDLPNTPDSYSQTTRNSSIFTLENGTAVNGSGDDMIAYCFAPVEGYSSFGPYKGNGSTDGTFVYTGFRPKFILFKGVDYSTDWLIADSSRSTYNVVTNRLFPNRSYYENQASNDFKVDFLSNGFKLRDDDGNAEGSNYFNNTHFYAAFAENPFKISRAR